MVDLQEHINNHEEKEAKLHSDLSGAGMHMAKKCSIHEQIRNKE